MPISGKWNKSPRAYGMVVYIPSPLLGMEEGARYVVHSSLNNDDDDDDDAFFVLVAYERRRVEFLDASRLALVDEAAAR